jgi:hypothetical protein
MIDMTDALGELADRVVAEFDGIHQRVFRGDPVANPRLKVEVIEPAMAEDTPTLVLITPWTLNGMAFPPDEEFPESLRFGDRAWPVFRHELEALGVYRSVGLVSHMSCLDSPSQARELAGAMAGPFRAAVARARRDVLVPDPGRRKLLRLGVC